MFTQCGDDNSVIYSNHVYCIFKEHFYLPFDDVPEINIHAVVDQIVTVEVYGKVVPLLKLTSIDDIGSIYHVTIDELTKILGDYAPLPRQITHMTVILINQEPLRIVCRSRTNAR